MSQFSLLLSTLKYYNTLTGKIQILLEFKLVYAAFGALGLMFFLSETGSSFD